MTYRTLFGLLAATGLRISEALHLKPQDVDLEHGTTDGAPDQVSQVSSGAAAFHYRRSAQALRSKLNSAGSVAKRPIRSSSRIAANRCPTAPFMAPSKICAHVWRWIARGGHSAPRIHDLRHSFICRSLLDAISRNQPPDNIIDTLSTYVGHAKVYRHLLVCDRHPGTHGRCGAAVRSSSPREVGDEDRHAPKTSFPTLLQQFFLERLIQQRNVSPQTVAAYRDSFDYCCSLPSAIWARRRNASRSRTWMHR